MCSCENEPNSCFCPILASYAHECASHNVPLNWRQEVRECGKQSKRLVCRFNNKYTLFCSVQVSYVRPARRSRRAVTSARTRAPTFRCTRRAVGGASKAATVRRDRRWTRMATACPSPSARACTRAGRLKREQRNLWLVLMILSNSGKQRLIFFVFKIFLLIYQLGKLWLLILSLSSSSWYRTY